MPKSPTTAPPPDNILPGLLPLAVDISGPEYDPDNARLHPERSIEVIQASLKRYGQRKPIVVNRRTNRVLAGNGTLKAARDLGWGRIAVAYSDDDDVTAAGYGLADNKSAEESEWDFEVLNRLQTYMKENGEEPIGWSAAELIAVRAAAFKPHADPDKIPDPPPVATTKVGDLWTMGPHRLICADASDPAAVARLMGKKKAALMATDPPYGVDFEGQKYNPRAKAWAGIAGDKRQGKALDEFLGAVLAAWLPAVDERAGFYFWTAAMQEGAAAAEAIRGAGLHIQSQIIWRKNCLVLGQADYHWMHENCWYAFLKGKKHRWLGGRDKTTVWEVKKVANSEYLHPMQKPVELYERPMEHHTVAGDVVAEPFCGSGTQIIAAHKTGRVCYGMEIDPVYCDVALQRFLDFSGVDPVRQDGKKFTAAKKETPAQ